MTFGREKIKMTTVNQTNYLSPDHIGKEFIVKAFENNNSIASVGPNIDEFEQVLQVM